MLPIRGGASIPLEKMQRAICNRNLIFDTRIAWAYYDMAPIFGLDPAAAMCQAIHETGWFTSDRAVKQNNFAGIGVTSDAAIGAVDVSVIGGVLRHLSHLVAYSADAINAWARLIDARYDLVVSLRPNKARAVAYYYQDLDGRWAVPGKGYGNAIEGIHKAIAAAK
jgi:N-acetylmuramoyl-L-alanine amidase